MARFAFFFLVIWSAFCGASLSADFQFPADTDVKIFTHHRSGRRKRRRSHQANESSRTSTRDKLKFPKQFQITK